MEKISLICKICKSIYLRYKSECKKGSSFCSRKCENQRTIKIKCLNCNIVHNRFLSEIKKGSGKYCSIKGMCYNNTNYCLMFKIPSVATNLPMPQNLN